MVRAADETHPHLLPHVRSSWTRPTTRPHLPIPRKNRRLTVVGAQEVTRATFRYRLGRRRATDFVDPLEQLPAACPPRRPW
ncbi:hypothetical protein [Streptomyces sp. 303MFCol5.2]|uniref:hypothetical protein n=1 Tax=Streptomyces sp. 303MFCol5.2 TaxID=1172181 RepID=UPI00036AECF2